MVKVDVVSDDYRIAATEILDIIEHLSLNATNKIPLQLLEFFKEVSMKDYKPKFDYSQGLEKISFTPKTKALLAMIYRNYLCSEEERKEFDKKLFENEEKYQQELREKYNPDNIFKNEEVSNIEENSKEENNQNTALIEYKEKKWYHKIFEKLVSLFKK